MNIGENGEATEGRGRNKKGRYTKNVVKKMLSVSNARLCAGGSLSPNFLLRGFWSEYTPGGVAVAAVKMVVNYLLTTTIN